MVTPKKKNSSSSVNSKTVVGKALNKVKTNPSEVDISSKFTSALSDSDFSGYIPSIVSSSKKSSKKDSKRKRSGSIINTLKNPFSTRESYQSTDRSDRSDRNTLRTTGKTSVSSASRSLTRLNVPRSSSRERISPPHSSSSSRRGRLGGGSGAGSNVNDNMSTHMDMVGHGQGYDHDASALEKGEFRREQSPLIPDQGCDSTNYQSFVHVEQAPVITQGTMPMTPIPLPGNIGHGLQTQRPTPFSLFLQHMYEKYPSYITGLMLILLFAGSMYSISTGKGTQYLTTIMKATLCWLLGSNTANLIFGDGFCEIDFVTDDPTILTNTISFAPSTITTAATTAAATVAAAIPAVTSAFN